MREHKGKETSQTSLPSARHAKAQTPSQAQAPPPPHIALAADPRLPVVQPADRADQRSRGAMLELLRPGPTAGRCGAARRAAAEDRVPRPPGAPAMSPYGQTRVCRSCQHWLARLWHNGYPAPCAARRWEGVVHVEPALCVDAGGVMTCSDFSPAEQPAPARAVGPGAQPQEQSR